jgi:hypothetical protein
MVSFSSIFTTFLVVTGVTVATPLPKTAVQPVVTYLGTQGPILCTFYMMVIPNLKCLPDFLNSERCMDIQGNSIHVGNRPNLQWLHCRWWH